VRILKGQKTSLTNEVTGLRKEKEKLEAIINSDKNELQEVLAQALMNLKQKRPDLFILTGQDQMVSLVQLFLGVITE
jgi:hypothetical protein